MDAKELKERDPKRFRDEYWKWTMYAADYDWWEYIQDDFKADCALKGVRVDDIVFSGFWSQGDGAAFAGKVYVYEWMEIMKLDEQYPIAYLACKSDGSYVTLRKGSGYNMLSNLEEQLCYSEPEGLFEELDVDEWHELVNEQFDAMSVETEVLTYCEDLAKDLFKSLRDEYDSLTSEEAFIDSCECNEITFEEIEDEAFN